MKFTKKISALILAMSVVMGGCSTAGESEAPSGDAAEAMPYQLGVAVPITGTGSSAGKMEMVGVTMAVNEINEAGGINGRPIEINLVDTASDPTEAANAVRKLVTENAIAIIGPHYSSEAEVTYPIGEELKIVQIALASSKMGLSDGYEYGFRNIATEDQISEQVIKKWVEDYGIERVAIMTDIKSSVALDVGENVFPPLFAELGVEVVTLEDEVTYQTDDVDFSAQITKINSMDVDGIALGSLAGDALNIIAEAREQGLTQPFVGAAPLLEGELEKKGGEDVQGTYAGSVFSLNATSEKIQNFIANYREIAPTMYDEISTDPLHYCANAYDATYMVAAAIEDKDLTASEETLEADRTAVMQYLDELENFDGLASYGFDDTHRGVKEIFVLKVEGDQWVVVE